MNKLCLFLLIWLTACGSKETTSKQEELLQLKKSTQKNSFFYSGIIQPLQTMVITSPAEGVIAEMAFHYGDEVKLHERLFSIKSEKFQTDYKTAFMQYIKSKTEFNNAKSQLKESEFLHQNQLISNDDFKAKQTNFYTAQLTLVQAKEELAALLKQLNMTQLNLYTVSIEEIDKITKALHMDDSNQILQVEAPKQGIALLPIPDGNETQTKKISQGDQVKQGDVLLMIGDMSGLTVHISVNEFNVNQLKIGQAVLVTGSAFPQFVLKGQIKAINGQAESSSSGMPVFPVEVVIPELTPEERAVIHIGMSVKVEVRTESKPELSVPIVAVFEKKGVTFVKIKKAGKITEVPVKTGQTTLDSVIIESKLTEGDYLVVPH